MSLIINTKTNIENDLSEINLDSIRLKIEAMPKDSHIEIAKILKDKNIKLTENNNGIFINLTNLSDDIKQLLLEYIKHIENQEHILNIIETKKEQIENIYFKRNKD